MEIHESPDSPMKTVVETAQKLNVSRSHVYQLMDRGELAYVKLGKSRRIPAHAIAELINRNMVTAR